MDNRDQKIVILWIVFLYLFLFIVTILEIFIIVVFGTETTPAIIWGMNLFIVLVTSLINYKLLE